MTKECGFVGPYLSVGRKQFSSARDSNLVLQNEDCGELSEPFFFGHQLSDESER